MHLHSNFSEAQLGAKTLRRVRIILAAVVVPLLVATIVGLVALWPRGESRLGSLQVLSSDSSLAIGEVTSLDLADCPPADREMGGPELRGAKDFESDGGAETLRDGTASGELSGPDSVGAHLVNYGVCVRITDGKGAGQTHPVSVPAEIIANGMNVGAKIRMVFTPAAILSGTPYIFWDFERSLPVGVLAVVYLLVVVAVARLRGLAAIGGLLSSVGVIVFFMVPAFLGGSNPMLTALVGASAMMFLSVYFAHGISIRTTTALLGTFFGLAVTVILAFWGTGSAHLTGATSDTARMLLGNAPEIHLQQILIAGMVIAGLGALNDVTITQASAVWELHYANPAQGRFGLWRRAMRIGRDHIASTVYTLAFAFVGTALPLLMLAMMMDRPPLDILLSADIAEEIVRTLVASIGLILAIPLTTLVGVLLVQVSPHASAHASHAAGDAHAAHASGAAHAAHASGAAGDAHAHADRAYPDPADHLPPAEEAPRE